MASTIQVERDAEGLQMALRELFEESFDRERLQPQADMMMPDDGEAYFQENLPPRTLSPGYYRRASYLLDLASSIEAGCSFDAASLSHSDVAGLRALKAARQGFEQDHPPCGRCGARQYSSVIVECHRCHAKIGVAA